MTGFLRKLRGRKKNRAETKSNAETDEARQARAVAKTDESAETQPVTQTHQTAEIVVNTEGRKRHRMTGIGLSLPRKTARKPLSERLNRVMYPTETTDRVINWLGITVILTALFGGIMGVMGKAIPDMIILLAGNAIGALAGIVQSNRPKEEKDDSLAGLPVQRVPEDFHDFMKQAMSQMQQNSQQMQMTAQQMQEIRSRLERIEAA